MDIVLTALPTLLQRYEYELLLAAAVGAGGAIYAGIKRWHQQQLEARPSVSICIKEVTVGRPKGLRLGNNRENWEVTANYEYSVAGEDYRGRYRRAFESEVAAWDLAQALDEQVVLVHYDPDRPSRAGLAESEVQRLLESSKRKAETLETSGGQVAPLFANGNLWLKPLMLFSAAGFLCSVYILVQSWKGQKFGDWIFLLHVLMFVALGPAVIIMVHVGRQVGNSKDSWKVILNQLPPWVKYFVYLAFAGVVLSPLLSAPSQHPPHSSGNDAAGFAGAWIAFYGISLLIFWAASRMRVRLLSVCPAGHSVAPGSRRCPECHRPLWRLVTTTDHSSSELQPL